MRSFVVVFPELIIVAFMFLPPSALSVRIHGLILQLPHSSNFILIRNVKQY